MRLETLRIRNFRNIKEQKLAFGTGLSVLLGDNAQGKTNHLEAIYYLATGRSFRSSRDEECLPFAAEPGTATVIDGRMRRGGVPHDIQVAFTKTAKTVRVDDKPLARLTDLWGVMPTVLFTPEDLKIVLGGPAARREYIDVALSQTDRLYLDALKRFSRALRQRNALLRRPAPPSERIRAQIEAYEGPLAEAGGRLFVQRVAFLRGLGDPVAARHRALAGRDEILELRYDHFLAAPLRSSTKTASLPAAAESLDEHQAAERYRTLLETRRHDDIARQQTLVGPHRDDMTVVLDGREARAFASQGQARTAALALRLGEADSIGEAVGHPPLLLLDDILSELDPDRLRALLDALAAAEFQTLLTTTDIAPLHGVLDRARAWRIAAGATVEITGAAPVARRPESGP